MTGRPPLTRLDGENNGQYADTRRHRAGSQGPRNRLGMTLTARTAVLDRVATAPISWGVCEMPGWGYQLPAERVLEEMAAAGFTHTELGAIGYLPTDPVELRRMLDCHGLKLLGGFVPLVLHDPASAEETRASARRCAALIAGAGGEFFVTCAVSSQDRWRAEPLEESQWACLYRSLAELDRIVGDFGLQQAFHTHVGSLVETDAETARILANTSVSLVLDTAHLTLGGSDLIEFVEAHARRVGLVHVKDVAPDVAQELKAGEMSLMQAVQRGLFPPLGRGALPIKDVVTRLENAGRDLWYVLEQDAAIAEGDASAVAGLRRNADLGIEFLRDLLPASAGNGTTPQPRLPEGSTK